MRTLMAALLLAGAGCSTAPIADLLDYTTPGRSTPDPYRRGENGPQPPPIPPVNFDRPTGRTKEKERQPPPPVKAKDDDLPPIPPPPSGE